MFMLRGYGLADSQDLTNLKSRFAMDQIATAKIKAFVLAPTEPPSAPEAIIQTFTNSGKPWYMTWWGLSAIVLGLYGGYRFLLK